MGGGINRNVFQHLDQRNHIEIAGEPILHDICSLKIQVRVQRFRKADRP
jgi:hypothetical protein